MTPTDNKPPREFDVSYETLKNQNEQYRIANTELQAKVAELEASRLPDHLHAIVRDRNLKLEKQNQDLKTMIEKLGEFDEAAVIQESNKFWEVVKGCRGETLAKHIARWQHAQTAALVNALKNDRYFYQKSRDEYKKLFDESQIKIAELEKRLKNG